MVLPIALILLVVLAVSALGFMRMTDASTMIARSASFQRDAVNRNELAINMALSEFDNAAGAHFAQLANTDQSALGLASGLAYSATTLPTDGDGVPLVLKDGTAFATKFGAAATTSQINSGDGMVTRLVIERVCGLEQSVEPTHCAVGNMRAPDSCSRCSTTSSPAVPIFRVTALTSGPRGIEAYTQSLFTVPFE